jgi:myo-inositol-1(or 4)-monophosphatase
MLTASSRNIRVHSGPGVGYPSLVTYLETAVHAAKQAGQLLREKFHLDKTVDEATQHDIKLALDKESQELITGILLAAFPTHAIYGEEGLAGDQSSPLQWIVDPIDGTVNYRYGIPHFCVSVALREEGELVLGVIYDPMVDELWTVEKGEPAQLNGREIACSDHTDLAESIIFVGFGKDAKALETGLERFRRVSPRVRKMRMMGSAALGMAYVATGRLDAYIEARISLWDIAAGKLLIEAGSGRVDLNPYPDEPDVYSIVATNGKVPVDDIL